MAIILSAVQLKRRCYIVNEPTTLIPRDILLTKTINLQAHFTMYDYLKHLFQNKRFLKISNTVVVPVFMLMLESTLHVLGTDWCKRTS
jgi:hypothetical protein